MQAVQDPGGSFSVGSAGVVRAAVFASGSGSNFQALLDHSGAASAYRIVLLVSDREEAGALGRAKNAEVPCRVVPAKGRPQEETAAETLSVLQEHGVEVIFLAGYLRLIPPSVVRAFHRRILNIHPALLPAFGGKGMWGRHVHEAVLASGVAVTGPTVHFVDEEYDTGPILAQWPVPVRPGDTVDALAARVLRVEHILYPLAATHLCRALREGKPAWPLRSPGESFVALETQDDGLSAQQMARALGLTSFCLYPRYP